MSNTIKVILVAVVIIAIAVFGYWYATSPSSEQTSGVLQSSNTALGGVASPLDAGESAVSDKFLALLLNMRTIKLDQSIFSDSTFTSLRDFSTTINPETNPGRVNPFAPIGIDAAGAVPLSVTTSPVINITRNTATFAGVLPSNAVVTRRFFEYGTTSVTPLPNSTTGVPGDLVTGAFVFNITGLTPNTTYYVRAATLANGVTTYGQLVSFKTLAQ